jgi:hypothetical protein
MVDITARTGHKSKLIRPRTQLVKWLNKILKEFITPVGGAVAARLKVSGANLSCLAQ